MNCANLPQAMVTMARTRSLSEVLKAVVTGIVACRNVVLARIWLIEGGDLCETCRFRSECPDQTRCLHLVASAGNPGAGGEDYGRLDGAFRRFPLGVAKIGRVARTGEPLLVPDVRKDPRYYATRPETASELVVPPPPGGACSACSTGLDEQYFLLQRDMRDVNGTVVYGSE